MVTVLGEKNTNFFRKYMYKSKTNKMVITYKFPLAFGLMAVTKETVAPGVGNLVQK
jgi:fumarate reductase subunit C